MRMVKLDLQSLSDRNLSSVTSATWTIVTGHDNDRERIGFLTFES